MSVGRETEDFWMKSQDISLEDKPTNSEFIDMLAYYLREMEEDQLTHSFSKIIWF